MSKLTRNYASKINSILKKIIKEEEKKFIECAKLISKSYKKGGQLYIFGTGHSRLLGEESFHRAGGFAAACPIRDDNLSFKKGAREATALERTPNIAKKALAKYKITKKDVLMIVSNSGVNHAPVEAAMIAKEKKIKTISLTSVKYSKKAPLSDLNKRLLVIFIIIYFWFIAYLEIFETYKYWKSFMLSNNILLIICFSLIIDFSKKKLNYI